MLGPSKCFSHKLLARDKSVSLYLQLKMKADEVLMTWWDVWFVCSLLDTKNNSLSIVCCANNVEI